MDFGTQLKKYINNFNLDAIDIASQISANSTSIQEIIAGERDITLKTIIKISEIFGLTYFQMGNPDFPIPKFENLPAKTQKLILKRKALGTTTRDYENDLAGNLDKILDSGFIKSPKTAEEIWGQLPEDVRHKVKSIRITDLLGKEPRKNKIDKLPPLPGTGRKNRFTLKVK